MNHEDKQYLVIARFQSKMIRIDKLEFGLWLFATFVLGGAIILGIAKSYIPPV